MSLTSLTKRLKDIMRVDPGMNGDAQYIEQISWMIFLKVFDYIEDEWRFLEEENFEDIIPLEYKWRNWAQDKEGLTGDKLLEHVNNMFKVLSNLTSDNDKYNRFWLVRTTMSGVNQYMKNGTTLRKVINTINDNLDFKDMKNMHSFNEIYESMLKDLQSAGKSGEFYTPRPITNFVAEMLKPTLNQKILDPACGTGGFLVSVIEEIKKKEPNTTPDYYDRLQSSILGIEKKPFPHLLCVTNMILHNISVPNILHDNALRKSIKDYNYSSMVDIIITNPPFGGAEEDIIKKSVSSELESKETADLFVVHIIELLKNQGECGIVLPNGFLFGSTDVKIRIKKKLLEECNLHTIVRLPKDIFAPYTDINTNLLFFKKGEQTKGIWFYRLEKPEGYKHFSKTKPILDIHLDPVRNWWNNRIESENSLYITIDDIISSNYNLDFCNYPHEEEEMLEPMDFIRKYIDERESITLNINNTLNLIIDILKDEKQ